LKKRKILSLEYDAVTLSEATKAVLSAAEEKRSLCVFTPGATVGALAEKDKDLLSLLSRADLLLADGVGVSLASRLAGEGRIEVVRGISLGEAVLAEAGRAGLRVFFYGGREGVAADAAKKWRAGYPRLSVAASSGYGDDPTQEIIAFAPDIVFVCLGVPRQEAYILKNAARLSCPCLALGGSLDVWSGEIPRAPRVFQKMGLEWLWRTVLEPRRVKRLLPLPAYFLRCASAGAKKLLRKRQKEG